jgi:hypothetical protein
MDSGCLRLLRRVLCKPEQTNGNRGIALAVFKRVWQIQAILVLGGQKTQFNLTIK